MMKADFLAHPDNMKLFNIVRNDLKLNAMTKSEWVSLYEKDNNKNWSSFDQLISELINTL